jgi:hypothetical protein
VNLDEKQLTKLVHGAVKETIRAHGPITTNLIASAVRRVVGQLLGHIKQMSAKEIQDEGVKMELARLKKIIDEKDETILSLRKNVSGLLDRAKRPTDKQS